MSPFCIPPKPGDPSRQSSMYGLTGIVVHSGGMGGGHYVAYTLRGPGRWYYFSDRSYSASSAPDVTKKQAYLCFYKRLPLENGDRDEDSDRDDAKSFATEG
mmetsp:Transcript_18716/g.37812  ORF Transcript_18716/g.37812 Transcript_18716/m.37812 type:complete len:101 (+) Transcript_18716:547-849(+)